MERRQLLRMGAASLCLPAIARAGTRSTLRFIPMSDLNVVDPHWTTAYPTRHHGYMVFDTLYGADINFNTSPQMVAGHIIENAGRSWRLTLRSGLKWHDGEPVLARDCLASILRWGTTDPSGQALMSATDELSAADDKTIVFRLKRPFPLLPTALAVSNFMPAMMPERLAKTPANQKIETVVGSGPFRFKADERIPGSFAAYERFADYVPNPSGEPDWTAGPKVVHVDRVEWWTTPDPATAAVALQTGERDWWYAAPPDLVPMLRGSAGVTVAVQDPNGQKPYLRMNFLHPPFSNVAIRQAVLRAVKQSDFMMAVAGTDHAAWRDHVGIFPVGSPWASDAGMESLQGPPDLARCRAEITAAGYRGEPVVLLAPSDPVEVRILSDIAADTMRQVGLNVDYQAMDFATFVLRRVKRDAPDQGGWSAWIANPGAADAFSPAANPPLRGNGAKSWYGWPDVPSIEALRDQWLQAVDPAEQRRLAADIQREALRQVMFVPVGEYQQFTVYRSNITGVLKGFPIFWNVAKQA